MARLDWYIRANLKPRHMQLLLALDELRHVGKVAAYLNITQPAVSKALGEIERGLEVALFDRSPKGLVPTAYGRCLIRVSRTVLRDLDSAREELRMLRNGAIGRVRIGVLPVAAPALAPRAALRLQDRHPGTAVSIQESTADRLLPMLREGLLDLVVGTLPPATMSIGLDTHVLHPGEGLALVCGIGHPLLARGPLVCADLAGYPLIVPPVGTIFREAVETALESLGLSMSNAMIESGSMTATNTCIRETRALSFYSQHLARHYAQLGLLGVLPLTIPKVSLPIGYVWPRHVEFGPSVRAMVECLHEVAREVMDAGPPAGPVTEDVSGTAPIAR